MIFLVKVIKFGGTSLCSPHAFKRVKTVCVGQKGTKFVVVSAPGKRFKDDVKVTDLLFLTWAHRQYGGQYTQILATVKQRFTAIRDALKIDYDLDGAFSEIQSKIKNGCSQAYLVSRGEYLCGKLLSIYLGYGFIDSKDFLIFDREGSVSFEKSYEAFQRLFKDKNTVVPGFYGSYSNGEMALLERDGSNETGGFLARFLEADAYDIRSDVSGIMSANPDIVANPRLIRSLSFSELNSLDYLNAKVISPSAVWMLEGSKTKIRVLNTFKRSSGTTIGKATKNQKMPIAIGGKGGFISLTADFTQKYDLLLAVKNLTELFIDLSIEPESLLLDERTLRLTLSKKITEGQICDVEKLLKDQSGLKGLSTDKNFAIVSIVGHNFCNKNTALQRVVDLTRSLGVRVKWIRYSADKSAVILGVEEKLLKKTISGLYNGLMIKNVE